MAFRNSHGLTLRITEIGSGKFATILRADGELVATNRGMRPVHRMRPLYADFHNTVTERMGAELNAYKNGDDQTECLKHVKALEDMLTRHYE